MKNKIVGLVSLFIFLAVHWSYAVPPGFNIQGRLTDENGVNRNGLYTIKFTIYGSTTGAYWSRIIPDIPVRNGNFQLILHDPDSPGALLGAMNIANPTLGIQVMSGEGIPGEGEPELVPRQSLVSVPFALKAQTVEEGVIPRGIIAMWSGSIDTIPPGWALCDGTKNTPDLRERFIVGAGGNNPDVPGSGYTKGLVGGENQHTLIIAEMPSHTHSFYAPHKGGGGTKGGYTEVQPRGGTTTTGSTGGNQPHENRPPYYALAFIMKL